MTSRELRNRRRAEERKTRKSQSKTDASGGRLSSRAGLQSRQQPESSSTPPSPAPTHLALGVSPETLAEFGPDFIAQANAMRERVHRGVPHSDPASQPAPALRPVRPPPPATPSSTASLQARS